MRPPSQVLSRIVVAVCLVVGLANVGAAAPLGLVLDVPDISTPDLTVAYDASTDAFSVTGVDLGNWSILDSSNVDPGYVLGSGAYSLIATIDGSGVLQPGGTVTILGDIGAGVTTLLAGSLTAFGFVFAGGGAIYEFLLSVTASEPALGFGATAGIIMSVGSSTNNVWGGSFTDLAETTDTAATVVPEPGSFLLVAIGGIGLAAALRRRRQKHA